jgi:hypothetical protein
MEHTAITYTFSGGRFGDNLIAYMHAKWLSCYYGIPLLYKPFPYSDCFVLHRQESVWSAELESSFQHKIILQNDEVLKSPQDNTLYICPYFPESDYELFTDGLVWPSIKINWDDVGFKNELKRLVCLTSAMRLKHFVLSLWIKRLNLPKKRITLAVHMRMGGGYDSIRVFWENPIKFPPESFYIEQIKKVHDFFNKAPLHVFIFTDYQTPPEIAKRIQSKLAERDISFDCHCSSHHTVRVLADFFALPRFDCLIRPDSNFSIAASKIADYKVIVSPLGFIRNEATREVVIDQVNFCVKL